MQFEKGIDDKNGSGREVWQAWYEMLQLCWERDPGDRPRFSYLNTALMSLFEEQSASLPVVRDIGAMVQRLAVEGRPRNESKSSLMMFLEADPDAPAPGKDKTVM